MSHKHNTGLYNATRDQCFFTEPVTTREFGGKTVGEYLGQHASTHACIYARTDGGQVENIRPTPLILGGRRYKMFPADVSGL